MSRLSPSVLLLAVLSGIGLVGGCAGTTYPIPATTGSQLTAAQEEVQVQARATPPQRRLVSDEEATTALRGAIERIGPAATGLCREMAIGDCRWTIRGINDPSLGLAVGPNGLVVIARGVMEYAGSEEEVAVVIAVGLSHHAANHYASRRNAQTAGSLIGTLVVTAASVLVPPLGIATSLIQAAAESGTNLASGMLVASYSKEQEREAIWLAALILYRAGVDLDKARVILVTMALVNSDKSSGVTAPKAQLSGPERLAAWDEAVRQIRALGGRLPRRGEIEKTPTPTPAAPP